jgi:hypothetical protein
MHMSFATLAFCPEVCEYMADLWTLRGFYVGRR